MSNWPAHPVICELNTWVWLSDLGQQEGPVVTLGNVPQTELERLAGYGFNGLWLMGVWERSPGARQDDLRHPAKLDGFRLALPDFAPEDAIGSPYAIHSYRVDARLGGDGELAELRARLSKLGLRLILDFVPNQVAIDHPWLSEHPEWFVQGTEADLERAPQDYFRGNGEGRGRVFAHGRDPVYPGWTDTAQLDLRRPDTRRAQAEILLQIAGRCDGVRCDLAMLVTHDVFLRTWGGQFDPPGTEFWPESIQEVKARYPDCMLLAEVYWDLEYALQQQGFDYTYDKRLYNRLFGSNMDSVRAHLRAPVEFQSRLVRFVDNHDEARSLGALGPQRSRAVALVTLTLPGMRLFTDDQIAARRCNLPIQLRRRPTEATDPIIVEFYKRLLTVLSDPVFHHGQWQLLETQEAWPGNGSYRNIIAFMWTHGEERRLVVANLAPGAAQCYVRLNSLDPVGKSWHLRDLLGDVEYVCDGTVLAESGLRLDLAGYDDTLDDNHFLYHLFQVQLRAKPEYYLSRPDAKLGFGFRLRCATPERKEPIYGISWSPDGQILAATGTDSAVRLWNTQDCSPALALKAHTREVYAAAWSPDGSVLASCGGDRLIYLFDVKGKTEPRKLQGHGDNVLCAAWSPDGKLLATGSIDQTVRVWDVQAGKPLLAEPLLGHTGAVNALLWLPDSKTLATGGGDHTIRIWNTGSWKVPRILQGHDWVSSLAYGPQGQIIAAGTGSGTIDIWDAESGRLLAICEGHTKRVLGVAFSMDGRLLASKSNDDTVRLWDCESWTEIAGIVEPGNYLGGVAFHPDGPILATRDDGQNSVRIWEVDMDALAGTAATTTSVYYTNAKVVLVGDQSVGKSALANVLVGQEYRPTDSTHGRRVFTFESTEVDLRGNAKETREIFLWDLAGQPAYRVIHQLHLQEVALALVVFDARGGSDPLAGVRYWDRALAQARGSQPGSAPPPRKLLVAAKLDRGRPGTSKERIRAFMRKGGYEAYFETSAKENKQIGELRQAIEKAIDWGQLTRVSSNDLFQRIKRFLVQTRNGGMGLSTVESLYDSFLKENPEIAVTSVLPAGTDLRTQFEYCIGRVESQGLIQRLSFGNLILVKPELLDAYASALVNSVDLEMGSILEEDARAGRFDVPTEDRLNDKEQEKLLLIATIEHLLHHEIALRETSSRGTYLIFPSQLAHEQPELGEQQEPTIKFAFEGPIESVYTTLIVRLSYSEFLSRDRLWKNGAIFTATVGGMCGLTLREVDEGRGELGLFFSEETSEETRYQFEEYVRLHLERRASKSTRRRIFMCERTHILVSDSQAKKRLEDNLDWIWCPVCEERHKISLLDRKQRLPASIASRVVEIDRSAQARREREADATRLAGQEAAKAFDAFISYSHKDGTWVENRLLPGLTRNGLRVYIDYENFVVGLPVLKNIELAIERCAKTLLVLTPNWVASEWANFEALLLQTGDPLNNRGRFLPLMLETSDVPSSLAIFTFADLRNPETRERELDRVARTIRQPTNLGQP